MSEIAKITITDESATKLTLSNVITSTPAAISDLTDTPIDTEWSVSNVTSTKSFDANATTQNEIADVLGTLIQKLIDAGILSA